MRSPAWLPPAAPRILCCICWPSPTKQRFLFRLTILIASVPEFRFLPISNREGGLSRPRSEEHTSELQSRLPLVCRLLLEKKKTINNSPTYRFSTYLQSTFYYNGPPHNTHDTTMQEVEEIYETVALTLST